MIISGYLLKHITVNVLICAIALIISACARQTEALTTEAPPLDCALPFETLKAKLLAQPLTPAPRDSAQPYRFYSTADGRGSYLITEPEAPAHPAIMMQRAAGGQVATSGCPYGDAKGYDVLFQYLDGLKAWRRS